MTDLLLELGSNPTARSLLGQLGLPLPLPEPLRRAKGPWVAQPLSDLAVAVGAGPGATLVDALARALVRAGASPLASPGDARVQAAFEIPGEAYGRPLAPLELDRGEDATRLQGLVFDASGLGDPGALRSLYDFLHPLVGRLRKGGRLLVLGRPPEDEPRPEGAAAQTALEGFVRSTAKELGRKGTTAQLVMVSEGAEDRLESLLRFLLSERSAFVTAQPFRLEALVPAEGEAPWVQPLEGQVALVTGAARGIGAATAERLAAEGAHVVCLDRPQDEEALRRLAARLEGSVLALDVTDPEAPEQIAGHLNEAHGGVDLVIHNAGVARDRTLGRMDASGWDTAIDVNLGAVLRITERLLDDVLYEGGRIVCMSSISGLAGNVGQTNYSAAKAGLVGYVRQLALDLAPRGITVNAVAPGFIETRMTAALPMLIREAGRRLSALGQGGLPQDVAEVIAYLASPGASGTTGQVIRVCGGAFLGA
ncbi:MAG: 3-oxoacyl-ACP reductase [Polyangia bacterium]|jgi:3-oxoacyl-[acyl-carrier protein] reductase|nr:3-oxoacyl-ACP reductase [Polyangia bacterium]